MLEGSCQDIQENFQQTVTLPLDENKIYQHLNVDIHVPFPEFDEDIHILSDEDKDEDSYSNVSSYHLFSKLYFKMKCVKLRFLKLHIWKLKVVRQHIF